MFLKIQTKMEYPKFQAKNIQKHQDNPPKVSYNQIPDSVSFGNAIDPSKFVELRGELLELLNKVKPKYESLKPMIEKNLEDGRFIRACGDKLGVTISVNESKTKEILSVYSIDKAGRVRCVNSEGKSYILNDQTESLKVQSYIKKVLATVK